MALKRRQVVRRIVVPLMVLAAIGAWPLHAAGASPTQAPYLSESEKAEPGLRYGTCSDFPLPKTILFSIGPDEIIADAQEWKRHGIDAFFLDFVARDWSSDIWAADGKPWTIGELDETFQKVRRANEICRGIGSETFLKIAFDHPFEWFNDTAWQCIINNFRQFAIFAKQSACTGIALDIEYVGEQYAFTWAGYDYKGYTRLDLVNKVRERATAISAALYDEFPEMVFLTFPETGLSLGSVIHSAWIEEAARRNAPGGVHYCTEYTYRRPNIRYMFGHAWTCNDLFRHLLSETGREYWREKCSVAAGVWPFGFNYQNVYEPGLTYDDFRQALAAARMMSRKYMWIYSHNCRELLIGRARDKYTGKESLDLYLNAIAGKETVTSRKYVSLAKDLRALTPRDYTKDLKLAPSPHIVGPDDSVRVEVFPLSYFKHDAKMREELWQIGLQYYRGEPLNVHERFHTQTQWMMIGPFANDANWSGFDTPYPPEKINLNASYDGLGAKVRWTDYQRKEPFGSVDFSEVFKPTEQVCAYALCWVSSPKRQAAQIRIGTNDFGKVWLGNELVYAYPHEGSAILDRDIVPVTLPKGTTPILVKVCNGQGRWAFVFRITDPHGALLENVTLAGAQGQH